ncbi:ABC transporter permease [uncultured Aeromicrobium sp.]|uniref:ABC transporter permease n=1 Tax=uncultured Aeromicrobium sp. TaxID=337820 RepID=UPI0025D02890|nr:ABC transporter permease [uncultured Aeromicrobium sp.]
MTRILTRTALVLLAILIAMYVLAPILVIFPMSVSENGFMAFPPQGFTWDWYRSLSTDPTWFESAGQSLAVALASAALSVVLGTLAALALVRGRFPFRRLVLLTMLSPLIVPYVIVGLAVYIAFLKVGLTETMLGFVLVHTCLGVPYVMINVSAGLVSVDRRLEMASMNLGAGPVSTFMRVTLPAILPNVLAGALFAFITSWDEVVVAIFLSGPGMTTLPVKMWSGIRVEIDPTLAAVSSLLLLVLIGTFVLTGLARGVQRLLVRRSSVNLDRSGA